jgi:hypothetical protein
VWLLYIRRLAVGFYDSCIVLHNLSVSVEEDRDVLGISKQIIIFGIFPFVPKHVETGELRLSQDGNHFLFGHSALYVSFSFSRSREAYGKHQYGCGDERHPIIPFHKLNCFYKLLYCFMVAKVQLSFEIKREGFPKVEGKIPISDFGYLFHFSGMAVIIKRDYCLLLKPNMTE